MVARGITCNYTGTAQFQMTMWKCTDPPSADAEALSVGSWGCSGVAFTAETIPVVANASEEVYRPHVSEGAPPVSYEDGFYWIATTLLTNPFPIVNGPPTWSQEGWQYQYP